MENLREILVALPPTFDDIYRRHQLVWRAWRTMNPQARDGREFIFAVESPNVMRLRSPNLSRGTPAPLTVGRLRVEIVAARRDGKRMSPMVDEDVPGWIEELMAQHGFHVVSLDAVSPFAVARGAKNDAANKRTLAIQLPTRTLEMTVTIVHRAKANLAWCYGIGRGKRFGYGMLQTV